MAARFVAAFREAFGAEAANRDNWTRNDRLTASEQDERKRWGQVVERVLAGTAHAETCFRELFAHFAQPSAWRCFPDVAESLSALKDAGYRLAIASNFDRRLHAICDAHPELREIELRVISSEVGYRKPSRHFYRGLVQAAACQPEQVLMVGDDYDNDIEGAQQAGLQTVYLQRCPSDAAGDIANLHELLEMLRIDPQRR